MRRCLQRPQLRLPLARHAARLAVTLAQLRRRVVVETATAKTAAKPAATGTSASASNTNCSTAAAGALATTISVGVGVGVLLALRLLPCLLLEALALEQRLGLYHGHHGESVELGGLWLKGRGLPVMTRCGAVKTARRPL